MAESLSSPVTADDRTITRNQEYLIIPASIYDVLSEGGKYMGKINVTADTQSYGNSLGNGYEIRANWRPETALNSALPPGVSIVGTLEEDRTTGWGSKTWEQRNDGDILVFSKLAMW